MQISFEQIKAIQSFAEQRDALISEKAQLTNQVDILKKEHKDLERNNSDLNEKIAKKEGILQKMEEYEIERTNLISNELASLSSRYSSLSAEVPQLELRSERLNNDIFIKSHLLEEINKNIEYQTKQIKGLDELVRNTVRINTENTNDLNHLVVKLKETLTQ